MNTYLKTTILFAAITALLVLVGYFLGGTTGAVYFFLFSAVMNIVMYWFSDSIALSMAGAHPIDRAEAPQVYSAIEELRIAMGLPMPRVYMSNAAQPNAFATGRGPEHSAVCVTKGLVDLLSPEEIRGVLAHELSHIKNRDVLISTIAAVAAGAITAVARIGFYTGGRRDRDSNPILGLIGLILAPIAAALIQLAISRTREYAADETGARYSGRPLDLASALQKIEGYVQRAPMRVNPAIATLYIQNPFSGRSVGELFSTHPATAKRVARLHEIANTTSASSHVIH